MWVAAAVVVGAGIGAVASNRASKRSASAAKKINERTLKAQRDIAQQELDFQKQMYGDTKIRNRGFDKIGRKGSNRMLRLLTGEDYGMEQSPSAQWTLQEATKMQNRQDAARGLSGSGSASARLGELGAQVAATDYAQHYARILDAINIGRGANTSTSNAGTALANASAGLAGQTMQNIGTSGANQLGSIYQQGQQQQQMISGLAGVPMDAYNMYRTANPPKPAAVPTPTTISV